MLAVRAITLTLILLLPTITRADTMDTNDGIPLLLSKQIGNHALGISLLTPVNANLVVAVSAGPEGNDGLALVGFSASSSAPWPKIAKTLEEALSHNKGPHSHLKLHLIVTSKTTEDALIDGFVNTLPRYVAATTIIDAKPIKMSDHFPQYKEGKTYVQISVHVVGEERRLMVCPQINGLKPFLQ